MSGGSREAPALAMPSRRGGAGEGRKSTVPSEINITPSFNGGFVVRHRFDNSGAGESYTPPKEHAFESHAAMMAHVHVATGGKPGDAPGVDEEDGETTGAAATVSQEQKPAAGVHGAKAPGRRSFGAGVD